MTRIGWIATLLVTVGVAGLAPVASQADSTPIGRLPPGPTSTIVTTKGELVSIALPHRSGGRVWRIARSIDSRILRQVGEGDVGTNVVLVFKTYATGTAKISVALTRGETAKALEARRFTIRVG